VHYDREPSQKKVPLLPGFLIAFVVLTTPFENRCKNAETILKLY